MEVWYNMTRAEMELQSLRTTIEAYSRILDTMDLDEEKKNEINEKIKVLSSIRDDLLRQTNNYGLEI